MSKYQHLFFGITLAALVWWSVPFSTNAASCWQYGLDFSYAAPGSTYQGVTPPSGSTCLPAGTGPYGNFNEGWGITNVTTPSPMVSGSVSTVNFTWTGVGYYNASQLAAYTASSNWPQTWLFDKFYVVDSNGYKRNTTENVVQKPTVVGSYPGAGGYSYYLFHFPVSISVNPPTAGTYYVRSNYAEAGGFGINTYYYLADAFTVTNPNSSPNTPTISGPATGVTSLVTPTHSAHLILMATKCATVLTGTIMAVLIKQADG